jgi:hypothetical protein
MVYHRLGFKQKPLSGRAITIFSDSSWHEELTGDWIRQTAFNLHSVQMVVDCFEVRGKTVRGSIDGVITDATGVDRLFEHKAINHFTFQRFISGEIPLDYVYQCCSYLRGLQLVNPDICEAILLIKNKNTSAYLEFRLAYDSAADACAVLEMISSEGETIVYKDKIYKDVISSIEKRFESIEDYADRRALPKRDYELSDWQCEWCGWGAKCWDGYEEEFAELQTGVILDNKEIETLCRYYKETAASVTDLGKEKDKLKAAIKKILADKDVREGRAGEYAIKLLLQKRAGLNKDLIPADILDKATKYSLSEVLRINKIKPKEEGK